MCDVEILVAEQLNYDDYRDITFKTYFILNTIKLLHFSRMFSFPILVIAQFVQYLYNIPTLAKPLETVQI